MKAEIQKILDFKENADYKKLSCDEIVILKDYITNLQEELRLERAKIKSLLNTHYGISNTHYKSRNEKAIKILKDTNVNMSETLLIETIDYARHILNGGDNNEC